MEDRKKFGELLKKLRQQANLSQDGFLNALNHLLNTAMTMPDSPLPSLLGDKELTEAATAFSKTDVSKYENGKTKPSRSRVLLFIIYFQQKGVIQRPEANCLLTALEYSALTADEHSLIFAEGVADVEEQKANEATRPETAALDSEERQAVPWSRSPLPRKWLFGAALSLLTFLGAWLFIAAQKPTTTQDWCDDFADGERDVSKWQRAAQFTGDTTPINAKLIYEQEGVLHLQATVAQTQKRGLWAEQRTASLYRPLREVSFQMTLLSDEGNQSSAGANVALLLADGQELSFELDLSGVTRRYLYKICAVPPCGAAESYTTIKEGPFPVGVAVPQRIIWGPAAAQVYIDNVLQVEPPTKQQAMTGVKISMWAHQGGAIHATIDEVCVNYQ